MASINEINTQRDRSLRIFDEFYDFSIEVDANDWDAVNSYFLSVFRDPAAAKNFSTTLFRIAYNTNTPVLNLLAEMQGLDQVDLTATMAYYLNGLRSPATMLGVNAVVTPNYYVARNVIP